MAHTLQEKLANPAWRASIPTDKLPTRYRLMRKANKRRHELDTSLYDPTQPLGGKNLRHSIDALVDMQINPLLSDLDHERTNTEAQSNKITGNARSYFDQLNGQQAALVGQAKQIGADENAAQTGSNRSATDAIAALAAQNQQAQNADADVRGDIARTASDQIAGRLADTAASQVNRNEADRLATSARSGAEGGLAVTNAQSGLQAGGEGINDLTDRFAKQLTDIGDKRLDVLAQRAPLRAKTTQDLRDSEFDKLVTLGGLNLKRDDLVANTTNQSATRSEINRHNTAMEKNASQANQTRKMQSDRQFGLDRKKFGFEKAKDLYQRRTGTGSYKTGGGKGGSGGSGKVGLGSLTADQEQTRLTKISSLQSLLHKGATPEDLVASGESKLLVDAARDLRKNGGKLSRVMAKKLQHAGVHIGGNFEIFHGADSYNGPN